MNITSTIPVAPSNLEQARAWDGEEGAYWADHARRFDESIARHHAGLMNAVDVASDAQILDVGCGTGQSTRDLAGRAPAGRALGIDLSARMLDVARREAARSGLTNVSFEQADAQVHPFQPASFDLIVSRTGAMFFGDKSAAFGNLAPALRPGGRLALLVWSDPAANEWFTRLTGALAAGRSLPAPPPDGPHPFSLAHPDPVRTLLERTGFTAITFDEIVEPMYFGTDTDDAYRFVHGLLGWMLRGLDDSRRDDALANLRRDLAEHTDATGVRYGAATWVITARKA